MHPVLALREDILSNDAVLALPALPRMIFVVHGALTVAGRTLGDGEAWHGEGAATLHAGRDGATCWCWELSPDGAPAAAADGVTSRDKISARLATLPQGELLLRGDSVGFPPGMIRHPGSLGLVGMRERAVALRASFEVTGGPEGGTMVRVAMRRPRPRSQGVG